MKILFWNFRQEGTVSTDFIIYKTSNGFSNIYMSVIMCLLITDVL